WVEKYLAPAPSGDRVWTTAEFLKGELLRRSGRPAEASRQFTRLKGMKPFEEGPFPRLLAEEERLLRAGEESPQEMHQGETFPVATEALIHLNGDEAAHLPGLAKAGAVSADSIVVAANVREGSRGLVEAYREAADAGDAKALDRLIAQGRAFRLKEGTRVFV